jgi:hypothetical protein
LIVFSSEHGLRKDFEAFEHVRDGAKNVDAAKNGCIWPIFNPKKYAQLGHNWEGQEILKFLIVGIDLFRSEGFFQVFLFAIHLPNNRRCKLKLGRYCAQYAFIKYFLI